MVYDLICFKFVLIFLLPFSNVSKEAICFCWYNYKFSNEVIYAADNFSYFEYITMNVMVPVMLV